jgi:hypothetical protein
MNKLVSKLKELFSQPRRLEEIPLVYDKFDWEAIPTATIGDSLTSLTKDIYDAYVIWSTSSEEKTSDFSFFNNNKSSGFALIQPLISQKDDIILPLIKGIVLKAKAKNYIVKLAEISTRQSTLGIVTQYQIYMKPSHRMMVGPKAQQLYGNLNLEYKIEDGTPTYFKLLAHTYQDRNFESAHSMEELMTYFLLE